MTPSLFMVGAVYAMGVITENAGPTAVAAGLSLGSGGEARR